MKGGGMGGGGSGRMNIPGGGPGGGGSTMPGGGPGGGGSTPAGERTAHVSSLSTQAAHGLICSTWLE